MPFSPFDIDIGSPPQFCRALPPTAEAADIGTKPYRTRELPSRQFSVRSQPNDLIWEYHPVLGFVHSPGSCSVCSAYAHHVVASSDQADASLLKAMKAEHEHQNVFFMDGFGEGMRHRSSNITEVAQLQEQLDTTKRAFEDCVAENESLHSELDQVKLKLLHMEEEESRQIRRSLLFQSSSIPSRSPPLLSSSHGTQSSGSSIGSSMELQYTIGEEMNRVPPRQPVTSLTTEQKGMYSRPVRQLSTTYASVASADAPQNPHTYNIISQPLPNAIPSKPKASNTPPATRNPPYNKYPRTMKELKDLMDLAHEQTAEGIAALSIVKGVCSRAHGTPRESKSFMQRWILMNWKNPYTATSAPAVGAIPNPRIDDSVDVWFEYLCTHPHSWPKGVRKDAHGPVMSDLIANRAVARMRPTESAAMRNDFISHVTDMFAVPGTYQHLLEKNNFVVAREVTYNTFSGIVTPDTIARHFADSGFTPEDAEHNFEPWAQNYKEC